MRDIVTFDDYVYDHKIDDIDNELCWNVFVEDVNQKKIVLVNIFHYNWVVTNNIIDIYNKHKKNPMTPAEFGDKVRKAIMHEYWSRSEYETIITSWPPYIDDRELDRLNTERNERIAKYGKFYCAYCNLTVGVKVDVYSQIMMNWNHFIKYLWDNQHLIKKLKKVK